jgi:hypothetical protein
MVLVFKQKRNGSFDVAAACANDDGVKDKRAAAPDNFISSLLSSIGIN